MIIPSTLPLPLVKWTWTADGKRVQVWVWPQEHPAEMDIDVSDLTLADALAEGSDPHAASVDEPSPRGEDSGQHGGGK